MKKTIRLTESDLHKIVKESVNRILNEEFGADFEDTLRWVQKKKPYMRPQDQERFARNIIAKRGGKNGIDKKFWLITLEWNENSPMASPNFPRYELSLDKNITRREMHEIKRNAEKYSPYDYLDFEEFDNEEEFNNKVQYMVSKGAVVRN